MTTQTNIKKMRNKLIAIFVMICLICTCAVNLVACGDKEENATVTDPTYSYSKESEKSDILNPSFSEGLDSTSISYPYSSATGWTISSDKSATSSSVSSGVVSTKEENWNALLSTLYDDSDFLTFLKNKKSFTDDTVNTAIRTEKEDDEYDPTDSDRKDYILKNYFEDYANPSTNNDATDKAIYMINNYTNNIGFGTAQKITSTNSVTLEKDAYYEVSVYVKTVNIAGTEPNDEFGANIRFVNTFNGSTQSEVSFSYIKDTDWTKYTAYIHADKTYTCTISIVLGLGNGNGSSYSGKNFAEGTVYFDDLTFKKLDQAPLTNETRAMVYGGEEKIYLDSTKTNLYDMSIQSSLDTYFTSSNKLPISNLNFTKSNIDNKTSLSIVGANSTIELDTTTDTTLSTVKLNKASATLSVKSDSFNGVDNQLFKVKNGEYTIISFEYLNNLSVFGSDIITVDTFDIYNSVKVKQASVATLDGYSEEWKQCIIIVKNNFDSGDDREFYLDIVIGPNNVATVENYNDFATGSVSFKNFCFGTGLIKLPDDPDDNQEFSNNIKNLITSKSNATVNLYTGYQGNFVEDNSSDEKVYNLVSAPGNVGDIAFHPTNVKGYEGVVPNHIYLVEETSNPETAINTRTGEGTLDGVAGLINTKYAYTNGDIKDAIGYSSSDEDIQALMINNITDGNYGYIADNITTVSASSYAKFTVKVRAYADAEAFIYLVDASKKNKPILTFNDFTVNTDVVSKVQNGTEVNGENLTYAIKITSDMCNDEGWATVNFYVATGKNAKEIRLEIWNGSRDGLIKSAGYVFVKEISISSSSGFSESTKWNTTFTDSSSPLYTQTRASYFENENAEIYAYKRILTDTEKSFNKEYPDQAVEYFTNYIWAKNNLSVYGVYNTIESEKVITNPYDKITEEDEEETGCSASSDPSTFWLSFSTILLIVCLVIALAALIFKNINTKRKANKDDSKVHYKVSSRIPSSSKKKVVETQPENTDDNQNITTTEEDVQSETEEQIENVQENENNQDNTSDYVYGDVVEDFNENSTDEPKEDKSEENNNEEDK